MVNAATAQLVNNYRDYQAALTPEQLAKFGNLPDTSATSRMDQLRSAILTAPFQLGPLARDWDTAYDQARESTDRTAGLISAELSATAAAAAQRASNLAGINSVILMLGLLVGIAIAVLVARSLIRSLRLLRSSALDVAERRLPQAVESMRAGETPDVAVEPVPIGTRDEVGQVARAFDAVHGQAVRLAAEQAALQANVSAMFINLSRRSQALVERQLQLIEALESNEQDADQLSNLFQLDHLATRMRRNSENLLVLAGTDVAKRNMAPVPVVDVLRAAVSEVEQYQRVVVQAPPAASLAGRAGSDVVHLLAELLDNATAFSPPESQVVMSTTRSPDGAIVIEISDRGVGMADDELADANTRLVSPSGVDVSASRRMGLFVVGRLAARHGIGVRLSSTAAGPGSGLTASVSVPPSLIPTGVPADAPRPAGVPMPAGVPAQGRPAEARPTWPDANGARSTPLSALVTGADAPGNAPSAAREASPTGGQSTLFPGKPPVNGNTTHGLPTRRPGSSLRPDGPPPTEAPPGGFFDDGGRGEGGHGEGGRGEGGRGEGGRGEGGRGEDGGRPPGEQARLDQEAAARRDRMAGGPGLTAVPPPNQARDDERSVSDDERSASDEGPADRPRLTKNFTESGDRPGPGRPAPSGRRKFGRRRRHRGAGDGQVRSAPRPAATRHRQAPHRLARRGPDRQRSHRRRADADADRRRRRAATDAGRTDTGRPDSGRADAERADTGRPDAGQSDAGRGDSGRTDAGRTDAGRTDADRSDADRSDADRSDTSRSNADRTDGGRSDFGRTDADRSDASRTDADRTDVSRTDAGESGSGRTDTGRTDTGRADGRTDANRTDAADRPSTDRPDASRPEAAAGQQRAPRPQAGGLAHRSERAGHRQPARRGRRRRLPPGRSHRPRHRRSRGCRRRCRRRRHGGRSHRRDRRSRRRRPRPERAARHADPVRVRTVRRHALAASPRRPPPRSVGTRRAPPPPVGSRPAPTPPTQARPAPTRPASSRQAPGRPALATPASSRQAARPSDAGQSGGWPSRAAAAGAPGGGQSGADQSGAAAFGRGGPADGPGDTSQGTAGGPGTAGAGGWGAAQGFSGPGVQSTGGHTPSWGPGAQSTGGHAPAWGRGDQADDGQAGYPGARPGDTGGYAARSFADGDAITPATGAEALPRRIPGPPSPTGPGPQPAGPYRTDQQAPHPEQYRSVSGIGGFPPSPAQSSPPPSRVPDPADELFAPRVPSLDPDGQLPGHDPNASAFDLGETTPIFEEIASAWFRSNRPVPVSWESDTGSHPVVPPSTTAPAADTTDPNGVTRTGPSDGRADGWGQSDRSPVGTPADGWPSVGRPAPGDVLADAGVDTPPSTRPAAPSAVPPSGVPSPSAPAAAGPPSALPPASTPAYPAARQAYGPADATPAAPAPRQPEPTPADFSTEADEGWLAASGAVADRPDELTAAGLPKRRPRARLIPGSAGSAVLAPAVTAARSAESIRGRLASYQQGVRQGRETRLRGHGDDHPAPPAASGADHDEESS